MSAHGTYEETVGRPAVRFVRDLRHPREAVWRMVTDPAELAYWFPCEVELELRPGGPMRFVFDPELSLDGEVLECEPPRRLVQTWRMAMDPTAKAEGFSRLTWEIEGPGQDGVCRLTVTHELAGMPSLFAMTSGNNAFGDMGGGGWPWILSDLKTLLETGEAFPKG